MSLVITSRVVSGVVVVDMSGRLCLPEVGLKDHVHQLLEEGHRHLILNLANVPYIDSFGLGQLVTLLTSIESKSGQMILLRPTDHVQRLLEITKLDSVFQTSMEEAAAVRGVLARFFAPGAPASSNGVAKTSLDSQSPAGV